MLHGEDIEVQRLSEGLDDDALKGLTKTISPQMPMMR